eukprot:7016578-Lingulodinium_polyedra.AAC.1
MPLHRARPRLHLAAAAPETPALSEASDRVADRASRNAISDRSPRSWETCATSVRARLQIVKTLRREIAF